MMMMKNFKPRVTALFIILFFITPSIAFANGVISNATITNVRIDYVGRAVVFFSSDVTNVAYCAGSSYQNAFMWDTTTAAGKSMYAFVLQAKATNSTVYAYGRGACITDTSAENLFYIEFDE